MIKVQADPLKDQKRLKTLQGPSFSIGSACSTGAHCIGVAMEQIQLNKADLAVAGAGEDEGWELLEARRS